MDVVKCLNKGNLIGLYKRVTILLILQIYNPIFQYLVQVTETKNIEHKRNDYYNYIKTNANTQTWQWIVNYYKLTHNIIALKNIIKNNGLTIYMNSDYWGLNIWPRVYFSPPGWLEMALEGQLKHKSDRRCSESPTWQHLFEKKKDHRKRKALNKRGYYQDNLKRKSHVCCSKIYLRRDRSQ